MDFYDALVLIMAIFCFILFFGTFIFLGMWESKKTRELEKKGELTPPPKAPQDFLPDDYEPEKSEKRVTVSRLACRVSSYGTKQSKTVKEYGVRFTSDDGEEFEYLLDEDFYLSLSEGQIGTLITVGGQIYDFILEENNSLEN